MITSEKLKTGQFVWIVPFPSVQSKAVIGKVTEKDKNNFATVVLMSGYAIATNRVERRATKSEVMLAMLER